MKKSNIMMSILFISLIAISGCAPKDVKGTVVSVPITMSLNEMMSGQVSNMTFSGDLVTVRLESGEEVQAVATHEQMEEAFEGKTLATLEKYKDSGYEGVEWVIISLEEGKAEDEE